MQTLPVCTKLVLCTDAIFLILLKDTLSKYPKELNRFFCSNLLLALLLLMCLLVCVCVSLCVCVCLLHTRIPLLFTPFNFSFCCFQLNAEVCFWSVSVALAPVKEWKEAGDIYSS